MRVTIQEIYDGLCHALTAYERNDDQEHDPDYDYGEALYEDVCEVVHDLAAMIN